MTELAHVVFYVRDLAPSVNFYTEIVGLTHSGSVFGGRGALLSGGRTHHELLLIEVGNAPAPTSGRRIGLYHVGWKVGNNLDELRQVLKRIEARSYPIQGMSDHTVSQSIYLFDPDGNEVELFVDDPLVDWRNSNAWMHDPVKPLTVC
ncbi:MAG: VOC family protein [Acidiferrobacterales bacterium]